jgi:predicted CXXCH cytochrome family protein
MLIIGGISLLSAPGPALAVPKTPEYVFAKGLSSTEIGVNWKPIDAVSGYKVYRSETQNGTYVQIGTTTSAYDAYFVDNDADYSATGIQPLPSSRQYFYKVAAYDSSGDSSLSTLTTYTYTGPNGNSVTVILSAGITMEPDPPKGVTLTDNHNATVTVTWNANREPNIAGYNIYRSEVSGGSYTKLNTSLLTDRTYTDSVTNYLDYYYRVTAVDSTGKESEKSAEKWIKPEARPPAEVPHVEFTAPTDKCKNCHVTHNAPGANLLNKSREPDVCYTCHDGTGSQNVTFQEFAGNYPSRHPVAAGSKTGSMRCADCHDSHLNFQATNTDGSKKYPKLLRPVNIGGTATYKGNAMCYKCHGVGSTLKGGDHETPFKNGIHDANMPNPASGTEIKCITCHEPHASPNANLKVNKDENACFACHYPDSSSSTAPDIYDRLHASPDADTRHDVLDQDQAAQGSKIECVNCHNPHGVTQQYKKVDPDNPAPDKLWTGTMIDFCLKCHDGDFPTEAMTTPYAPGVTSGTKTLLNIKEKYYFGTDGAADKHGEADGQPKNFDPTMGYSNSSTAPNYILSCEVCHEPHGTVNGYQMRSEITSLDGTKTKRGLMTFDWYYLDNGVKTRGVDARFFCNGCHGIKHMGNNKSFPNDCFKGGTGCHSHGKKF